MRNIQEVSATISLTLSSIQNLTAPVVTVETDDSINLVKIKVKTDDAEALERWLEGEKDAENEDVAGSSADAPADTTLPDDNISQYGGDDDSAE